MFTLTLFSWRIGAPFVGKLLIGVLCFVMLNQSTLSRPTALVGVNVLYAQTNFQLVENFDALAQSSLHGQNGWQASTPIAVIQDPDIGGNQVMWMHGQTIGAYKALLTAIADTDTGTIHFRLRRDGAIDGYAGSSTLSTPSHFTSFTTQFGSWITLNQPTHFAVRDAEGFKDLGPGFTDRTWYCVWLVANNPANTYEVHIKGGDFANITQLTASGQSTFVFRNSGAEPIQSFFTRAGDTTQGDFFIDDIYVDPTAKNLTTPNTRCGTPPTDTTPPTVNWTVPVADGQSYAAICGVPLTLAVTATDAGGVNRVEFSRLNNSVRVPIANDNSTPYETTLNVCDLNFGLNEITAAAVDNANNQAASKISINRNAPPTVNAGADQTITLAAGMTLNGAVTDDGVPNPPGAVTVTWSKQSGPGAVIFANANAAATTATFSTSGLYTLRLTAHDSQVSSTDDLLVAVNSGSAPPTPQFTADKTSGTKPLTVNFTDQSTGVIDSWGWDFGDGMFSTGQNPSHIYNTAGDYTVSLAVTGPGGTNSRIVSAYIHVADLPIPGIPTLLAVDNSDQDGAYIVGWNTVDDVTAYELQEQVNSSNWRMIYSGAGTSHMLVNNTDGVWCYRVRALSATASGGWSDAQCTTVNVPPTATPTSTPTATPSSTPSSTPFGGQQVDSLRMYLPIINRSALSTPVPPTPTPGWQLVGEGTLNAEILTRQGDKLFVGERKSQNRPGGLYQRPLNNCAVAPTMTRLVGVDSSVFGIAFNGIKGLFAAYDQGIFYASDGGNTWVLSASKVDNPRSVIINPDDMLVGTENNGLYFSTDDGKNWTNPNIQPDKINIVRLYDTTHWVGTPDKGVWKLTSASTAPVAYNIGLAPGSSQDIWDFAFDQNNNIYVATSEGVYRSNINNIAWQPFGLENSQLRSLEIVNDKLYAGLVNQGVWQRSLSGDDWAQVTTTGWNPVPTVIRDLAYESACQGLLAATSGGIWFYRLPTQ